MNKRLSILVLFTLPFLAVAQPVKLWQNTFKGNINGTDHARSVISDAQGNVYVTGRSYHTTEEGNFTTIMYAPSGTQRWADHQADNELSVPNEGVKLAKDRFGNVYATGTLSIHSGDLAILKYDANGRKWTKTYEHSIWGSAEDHGTDIGIDSIGNIYAIAYSQSTNGALLNTVMFKTDSAGNKLWSDDYDDGNSDDFTQGLAVTPRGNVFGLTNGSSFFGSGTMDINTINYTANGQHNWVARYDSPVSGEDFGRAIKAHPGGNQFIAGAAATNNGTSMIAICQNSYGTRLWTVLYNGSANGDDTAIAIDYLSSRKAVMSGNTQESNGGIKTAITTLMADSGMTLWSRQYFGPDNLGAWITGQTTDAAGNIYVCGYTQTNAERKNGCILKYNHTGSLLWAISFDAGTKTDDVFNAITLDPAGNILVTGYTTASGGNTSYLTVKYAGSTTSVDDVSPGTQQLTVTPVPFTESVTIQHPEKGHVTMTDLLGRTVFSTYKEEESLRLTTNGIPAGVYYIRFESRGGHILYRKVVKH